MEKEKQNGEIIQKTDCNMCDGADLQDTDFSEQEYLRFWWDVLLKKGVWP